MKRAIFTFVTAVSCVALMSAENFPEGSYSYATIDGQTVEICGFSELSSGLKEIVIPEYVYHNGDKYFVTGISAEAFSGDQTISSLTIPEGIKYVENRAFSGCTNLKSLINHSTVLEKIGEEAFANTNFPEFENLVKVGEIGDKAFYQSGIQKFVCYNRKIGNEAFAGSKLEKLAIFVTTGLGKGSFKNCKELDGVYIDDAYLADVQVYNLPEELFAGCDKLENLRLPSNIGKAYATSFPSGLNCLQIQKKLPEIIFDEGATVNWKQVAVAVPDALYDDAKVELAPLVEDKFSLKLYWGEDKSGFYFVQNSGKEFEVNPYTSPACEPKSTVYAPSGTTLTMGFSTDIIVPNVPMPMKANRLSHVITLNGKDISEVCDWPYIFVTITEDSVVRLDPNGNSGIEEIGIEQNVKVYDLNGNSISVSELSSLPKGLYIVKKGDNASKMLVK